MVLCFFDLVSLFCYIFPRALEGGRDTALFLLGLSDARREGYPPGGVSWTTSMSKLSLLVLSTAGFLWCTFGDSDGLTPFCHAYFGPSGWRTSGLKSETSGLKSETSGLKSETSGLKSETSGLKSETSGLKS